MRLLLPFLLLFLVSFVALEATRRYLSPEYHEVLDWLQYAIGFVIAVLLFYRLIKGYRSSMRITPKKWIFYEGRAIPLANLVATAVFLSIAFPFVAADIWLISPGSYPGPSLTSIGILYIAMGGLAIINGLLQKLYVEKDGLVLKGGISRLSMFMYIPFDELESLTLRGRIFSYKENRRLLRNRFLVKNPEGIKGALDRSWGRHARTRIVSAMKMHYEGRAISRRAIVLSGFTLLLSLVLLLGGSSLLPHGYHLGMPVLTMGLVFLAFAALSVRDGLQTELSIVDDGLVVRQRPLPSSRIPYIPSIIHIPFTSLSSLELRSKIFTYRGKEGFVRGWFIVQDSKRLASVIDRFWKRK